MIHFWTSSIFILGVENLVSLSCTVKRRRSRNLMVILRKSNFLYVSYSFWVGQHGCKKNCFLVNNRATKRHYINHAHMYLQTSINDESSASPIQRYIEASLGVFTYDKNATSNGGPKKRPRHATQCSAHQDRRCEV